MSPLGDGRDWKDPDLSQVCRGNVSQVRKKKFYLSIYNTGFISCQFFIPILG
jgi:hypothetical protein